MIILVDFLLSKSTWMLLFIIGTITFSVRRFKKLEDKDKSTLFPKWVFLSCLAVIVVPILFVASTNFMVNTIGRPSRVDTSPLASLDEYQIDGIEDILMKLIDEGLLSIIADSFREFSEDSSQGYVFSAQWISQTQSRLRYNPSTLGMSVRVFSSEEIAISEIQPGRIPVRRNTHNTFIQYDNNVDALLVYPEMPVSASGLYLPSNDRWIISQIRIGRVILRITETRRWYDLRNDYTSQFIATLVEMSTN